MPLIPFQSAPQPKVQAMLRGDFANLSERKPMDGLNRLGCEIAIEITPTTQPREQLRVG